MGDPLREAQLRSFQAELEAMEKDAGIKALKPVGEFLGQHLRLMPRAATKAIETLPKPETAGWFGGTETILNRLRHPIKGAREAWREMSPRGEMLKHIEQGGVPTEALAHAEKLPWLGRLSPAFLRGYGGEHLSRGIEIGKRGKVLKKSLKGEALKEQSISDIARRTAEGEGGALRRTGRFIRGGAEELSRRGWTGGGELTKYLPVGQKGVLTGFTAAGVPGVVNAEKATPTGEGGALERGIGLGTGSAAWLLGMGRGVGMVPGTALWLGGEYLGSRAGRILDRLRAGASLGEAVSAPSPQQAAAQINKIQRYYGG